MLWCCHLKIARALSVAEGKGEVSWWASQLRSLVGMEWRGKRAAWSSGSLKSRQMRQDPWDAGVGVLLATVGFGFDAFRTARSGFDVDGIGGGAPSVSCAAPGREPGRGGGVFVDLFIPNAKADCLGRGGGNTSARTGRGGCSGICCC